MEGLVIDVGGYCFNAEVGTAERFLLVGDEVLGRLVVVMDVKGLLTLTLAMTPAS